MDVDFKKLKGVEPFIKECFQRFGSMNKNNYEVALFHLLMQNDEYRKQSDFMMSIILQTPESKIKRMRYEESLVYPKSPTLSGDYYQKVLSELLLNRKYRVHNDRIQFSITDKHIRLYINDVLNSDNRFADSSFNASIVSLTPADLLFLMEKANVKSKDNIRLIREEIESGKKELEKEVAESFNELSDEMLRELFRKVMSDSLINKLEKFAEALVNKINNRRNKKQ